MSELLNSFRKTFFLSGAAQKWEPRFLALYPIQQEAVITLLKNSLPIDETFTAIESLPIIELTNDLKTVISDILQDHANGEAW